MLALGFDYLGHLVVFPGLADLSAAVSVWSDNKEACSCTSVATISDHTAGGLGEFRK